MQNKTHRKNMIEYTERREGKRYKRVRRFEICLIGTWKERREKNRTKVIFEIIIVSFSKLVKNSTHKNL